MQSRREHSSGQQNPTTLMSRPKPSQRVGPGPKSPAGKRKAALNSMKNGHLSMSVKWAMAYAGAVCEALDSASNLIAEVSKQMPEGSAG